MNELRRSVGKAEVPPAARQAVKTRPAQPRDGTPNIGEPEQQKGPSRRRPQGDCGAPLSDPEDNKYACRQRKRNDEGRRPHPIRWSKRAPTNPDGSEAATFRRASGDSSPSSDFPLGFHEQQTL